MVRVDLNIHFYKGLLAFIIFAGNVNIINVYTDKEEDEWNLPKRVRSVECHIGYSKLPYLSAILYIIAIILALDLFRINEYFTLIYMIAVLDSIIYSAPPFRLKARPILCLISFSGAVLFPLLGALVLLPVPRGIAK